MENINTDDQNILDTTVSNGNGSNGNGNGASYKLPEKVAILYTDAKPEYFPTEALYTTEKDAEKEAGIIASYVEKLGIQCKTIPADQNLISNILEFKPEMVFNLVYSVKGSDYVAATVPAILDYLDIPYTGADFFGFAFNTDKFLVKEVLQRAGVPVPHYQLFTTPNDIIDYNLRFPLISKLNEIHCGVEITKDSISENEKHLRERLKYLISTYKQPVLVEEFIAGREVTAILLEGVNKKVYFGEKIFNQPDQKYNYVTFEEQWLGTTDSYRYEKYEDPILREYVKKAFDVTRMYDYAKFDVRVDQSGRYYFIDANCNPAFGPKIMQVALSSIMSMYGISFNEILRRLIINTLYMAPPESKNGLNGLALVDYVNTYKNNNGTAKTASEEAVVDAQSM